MTDKIKELKALIETLAEDSPLRKKLQDALDAELKRMATGDEQPTQETQAEQNSGEDSVSDAEFRSSLDELRKLIDKLVKEQKKPTEEQTEGGDSSSPLDDLEKLVEDDEFISASAGFVLGLAVAGIGALAISSLKK